MVKDINTGSASSSPASLTVLGNTLYFEAYVPSTGRELWKSDGTSAGTTMVKDIFGGSSDSHPNTMCVVGTTLYFQAGKAGNDYELWRSDGTEPGTVKVKDIHGGGGSSNPTTLVAVGDHVYFQASEGYLGTRLWKSDGTETGTVMVSDILTNDGHNAASSELILLGKHLFFSATTETYGRELYKYMIAVPAVTTLAATNVTATGATLNGTVNPNGTATTAQFEYGTTTSYGSSASVTLSPNSDSVDHNVSVTLSGLISNALYHYRLKATNAEGSVYTSDSIFSVQAVPEIVLEQPLGIDLPNGGNRDLGIVSMGLGASRTFTIKNTGTSNLTGLTITKDGGNPGDFSITTNPVTPVVPAGSTTFTVQFTPEGRGDRSAVIHIASNDSDESSFNITLTGNALSAEPRLSSLTLSDGSLAPVFLSNTTEYSVKVAYDMGYNYYVTPTSMESHATLKLNSNGIGSGSQTSGMNLLYGDNPVVIVSTAEDGVSTLSYTITVTRQTQYQTWIDSLTAGSGSLPMADFEKDGLVNLLEFAFGTDPATSKLGTVEVINSTTLTSGTPKVIESAGRKALFVRRKDWPTNGLAYTMQFSPNLSFWENSVAIPTVIADDGTLQAVTVPFPGLINGEPARFFRVKVNGQ